MRYKRLYTKLYKNMKNLQKRKDKVSHFDIDNILLTAEVDELDEKLRNTGKETYLPFEHFK